MLLKNKTVNAEEFNIIVDNDILNLTDDMTVLGINIDNKLNFNSHVSSMCNKAGRQLNVLQRLKAADDDAGKLQPVFLKRLYLLHICIFSFFLFNASLTTI